MLFKYIHLIKQIETDCSFKIGYLKTKYEFINSDWTDYWYISNKFWIAFFDNFCMFFESSQIQKRKHKKRIFFVRFLENSISLKIYVVLIVHYLALLRKTDKMYKKKGIVRFLFHSHLFCSLWFSLVKKWTYINKFEWIYNKLFRIRIMINFSQLFV